MVSSGLSGKMLMRALKSWRSDSKLGIAAADTCRSALGMNEALDVVQAVKVLGNHFFILNLDLERVFEISHQFDEAGGIDDVVIQERLIVSQLRASVTHQKI